MSKVVAIMSMSLDGFVADLNDGVAEVFDWYLNSGDVEFHTGGSDPMTFKHRTQGVVLLHDVGDRRKVCDDRGLTNNGRPAAGSAEAIRT